MSLNSMASFFETNVYGGFPQPIAFVLARNERTINTVSLSILIKCSWIITYPTKFVIGDTVYCTEGYKEIVNMAGKF